MISKYADLEVTAEVDVGRQMMHAMRMLPELARSLSTGEPCPELLLLPDVADVPALEARARERLAQDALAEALPPAVFLALHPNAQTRHVALACECLQRLGLADLAARLARVVAWRHGETAPSNVAPAQ